MGVDLDKVQDYTVITIYDRTNNKQVYKDRFNKLEWPYQKAKIIESAKHYNDALVVLDATGLGDPIADDLIRAGIAIEPFKLTNTTKKEIIEKMSIWIDQHKISMINLPETITEFTSFTYDVSSTGRIMYNAPVGFHDDIVISHCLAVSGLFPIPRGVKTEEKTKIQEIYEAQKRGQREDPYIDYEAV